MAVFLSPLPIQRFHDNNNNPLVGGLLYTYQAGTSTPQATYTDATGATPNTNPIVLNARGECSCWMLSNQNYKMVLTDAAGNTIWTVDQVSALPALPYAWCGTAGGSANALTFTSSALISNIPAGQKFAGLVTTTNSSSVTVSMNGQAALNLTKLGNIALSAKDIKGTLANPVLVEFTYDGTQFELTGIVGVLPLSGGSLSGGINEARGSIAMDPTAMNPWAGPNVLDGTGSAVTITAIANAPQAGARRILYPIAGSTITNGVTFAVDGGANYTAADGDKWEFEAITTSTFKVHVLKKDGTAVVAGAPPTMQVFTANGTWNRPAGCKKIKVYTTGGGGASSNSNQGGGGGGTAIKLIDVTGISSVVVTVGAGGVAPGGVGGTSSFGAYCSATGGSGGSSAAMGGIGTGGDLNLRGGPGSNSGNTGVGSIDVGGCSFFGGGAVGDNAGGNYGGGGAATATNQNGGPGVVMVEEYY